MGCVPWWCSALQLRIEVKTAGKWRQSKSVECNNLESYTTDGHIVWATSAQRNGPAVPRPADTSLVGASHATDAWALHEGDPCPSNSGKWRLLGIPCEKVWWSWWWWLFLDSENSKCNFNILCQPTLPFHNSRDPNKVRWRGAPTKFCRDSKGSTEKLPMAWRPSEIE